MSASSCSFSSTPSGRHGRNRQALKSFGEFGVRVHEAFDDVGLVAADGDAIEDGADVAALAVDHVAGGAGGRRAVVEQILAALGIARRDLHLVLTDAGDFVDAPQQRERVVQERVVGIGGDARELGDDGLDFRDGRELGEFHEGSLAREQIRILNHRDC